MGENINITFCRCMLRTIREDAKERKIKIPKLSCFESSSMGGHRHFEVSTQSGDTWLIVWSGYTDNAYMARYQAISKIIGFDT